MYLSPIQKANFFSQVKEDVAIQPERYSQLYVPNPFISPGERFREFYYWYVYALIKSHLNYRPQGKVIIFRSVCLFIGGGVRTPLSPLRADPSMEADPRPVRTSSCSHCSGWYASYWNTFLLRSICCKV